MKPSSEQNAWDVVMERRWIMGLLLFVTAVTAIWCVFWLSFSPESRVELFPIENVVAAGEQPEVGEKSAAQSERESGERSGFVRNKEKLASSCGRSAGVQHLLFGHETSKEKTVREARTVFLCLLVGVWNQ